MAEITFLGTANAMPNKDQESAHLLIETGERVVLIDCAGNPVVRLDQLGFDPRRITDIILTHFHPDHVAGLPLLMLDLWLMGREAPLNIFGLHEVIDRAVQMLNLFGWQDWEGFFPVEFHHLPDLERMSIIDSESIKIFASPTCHSIPSLGVRMQFSGGSVCYSSDTAPCDALASLADGVEILIHEATGEGVGHTSPAQAGAIAQKVGAGQLILIHYPTSVDLDAWVSQAKSCFSGEVIAARDWMQIQI
ncbi:MAG: MBL fold metallo-hydrolase [Brevefilum sp.]